MSVRIVPARSGKGWEYDVRFTWPEGGRLRERGKCPLSGKDAARRWAEQRERTIFTEGKAAYRPLRAPEPTPTTAPTLAAFWPRVVSDHYKANRKKPSTIEAAESIYRNHLAARFGAKALDAITTADVAALKGALAGSEPKTVNNILSVLSRALRCAVDWEVIKLLPCKFGLLAVSEGSRDWYEAHEFQRLMEGAAKCSPRHLVLVLLGGAAGLRRGEIRALRWTDVDFARSMIRVESAVWRSIEGTTKGGRYRDVNMTPALVAALRAIRGPTERVLYSHKGRELSNRTVRNWMAQAQRRGGLKANGGVHLLRHTFCSHLAIAGVPAKAIQELAGHADLKTTLRYMHLAPGNRAAAVAALGAYQASASEALATEKHATG